MILEPTLGILGQFFIVIGGFLAQKLKVKCISNVFGDTFLMLSRNIFYDHDASVLQLRYVLLILFPFSGILIGCIIPAVIIGAAIYTRKKRNC